MEEFGARLYAAEKFLLIGGYNRLFLIFKATSKGHRKICRCDLFAFPRNQDEDAKCRTNDGILWIAI